VEGCGSGWKGGSGKMNVRVCAHVFALLWCGVICAGSSASSHKYGHGQRVPLYGVRVGPLENPFEKYDYFSLPFCLPPDIAPSSLEEIIPNSGGRSNNAGDGEFASPSLMDLMLGITRRDLGLQVRFRIDAPRTEMCAVDVSVAPVRDAFEHALRNRFWLELSIDELPIYALIGQQQRSSDEWLLMTHMKMKAQYNGPYVVGFAVEMTDGVLLRDVSAVEFSYEVEWQPSSVDFTERFEVYLDLPFFENRLHLMALANAFAVGLLMVGVVAALMLRALRRDQDAYGAALEEDEFGDSVSESDDPRYGEKRSRAAAMGTVAAAAMDAGQLYGWRSLHGDVFREPAFFGVLSSFIGTGMALLFTVVFVLTGSLAGSLYASPQAFTTCSTLALTFSGVVSGYYSAGIYRRGGGSHWHRTLVFSTALLPCVLLVLLLAVPKMWLRVLGCNNALWTPSRGGAALIAGAVVFVWTPLHIFGAMIARHFRGTGANPCATNALPRPIEQLGEYRSPTSRWWSSPAVLIPLGGVLPFGVVFVEVYYVVASFWNYKFYFVFDLMLAVLLMLIVVTSCSSIVVTYVLLQAEDYRWPWVAFLSGAWCALYVFLYTCLAFSLNSGRSVTSLLTALRSMLRTTAATGGGSSVTDDARAFVISATMYLSCSAAASALFALLNGAVAYIAASVFVRSLFKTIKTD